MADRFWIAGTGNWSDNTNHWSASSGGAGGATLPSASDNVFFDANSFTAPSQVITVDVGATCLNMDWTGATNSPTLTFNSTTGFTISGSLVFISSLTITNNFISDTRIDFNGSGNHTIDTAGVIFPSNWSGSGGIIRFNGTGSWSLLNILSNGQVNATIQISSGTLTTNGHTITTRQFDCQTGISTRAVSLGNSTINVMGWGPLNTINSSITNLTFSSGSSKIFMTTAGTGFTFYSGGLTYYNLDIEQSESIMKENGTFNNLVIFPVTRLGTKKIFFTAGARQTVKNNFKCTGVAGTLTQMRSTAVGGQYYLKTDRAQNNNDYIDIQDSIALGPGWYASNSTNSGNNSGWYFGQNNTLVSSYKARKPVGNLLVSWKKGFNASVTFFTIGVSTIGSNDYIAGQAGVQSAWNKYQYFDESDYLLSMDWERRLQMPMGGISMALADGRLDNTSGRFTPRYAGGSSELYTAVLPRRPVIISSGLYFEGSDHFTAEFVGIFRDQPKISVRNRTMDWQAVDFLEFLNNRYVDDTAIFTGVRSDQLIETLLVNMGYTTAQYDLDTGINPIPFAIIERGQKYADIVNELVQAEYGHFYQDPEGVLRFENRQHWDGVPHNEVSFSIFTSQVLEAEVPSDDHIINVVEIEKTQVREKQPEQTIFKLSVLSGETISASSNKTIWIDFENPILSVTTPTGSSTTSFFKANSLEDESGTDLTSSITIDRISVFANSAKLEFRNSSSTNAFLTQLVISGRAAVVTTEVYHRAQDDSSVTAFEERRYAVSNKYIQNQSWAESLSQLILDDFSDPENLQNITIKAVPGLKIGNLISWQGRHWRVFGIRTTLEPSAGYIQELTLLQRQIVSYFRIGISLIGGTDKIAP